MVVALLEPRERLFSGGAVVKDERVPTHSLSARGKETSHVDGKLLL